MSTSVNISRILVGAALFACTMLSSCSDIYDFDGYIDPSNPSVSDKEEGPSRYTEQNTRDVFVLFSLGHNNLHIDLENDIKDIENSYLPSYRQEDDIVLIFSHSYGKGKNPVLMRLYEDINGRRLRDTLTVYPEGTHSADAGTIRNVLTYVKDAFPAKSYGIGVSSHATGWAPEKYCYSPPDVRSLIERNSTSYSPRLMESGRPLTKSIGCEYITGERDAIEMEITEFAAAIPMKLDYIIFDACFMGGVEVAYQLRNVCDKVFFSQTEILSFGIDYTTLLSNLFEPENPDIEACARSYYDMYMGMSNSLYRSATISVIDCGNLERLAEVVKKNRDKIADLATDASRRRSVQGYYQSQYKRYHGIFFDLRDIMRAAGVTEEDLKETDDALEECVLCRYATETFLNELPLSRCCGLSMYLPDPDREMLNEYYPTLDWGMATNLIENNNTEPLI